MHMSSTMDMECSIPNSFLLYASWYSGCAGVVLLAEIMCFPFWVTSILRYTVPHSSLKYSSPTVIDVPFWRVEDIFISVSMSDWSEGFHIYIAWGGFFCSYWWNYLYGFECRGVYLFFPSWCVAMRGCGVWIIISKCKTTVVGYLLASEDREIGLLSLGRDTMQ